MAMTLTTIAAWFSENFTTVFVAGILGWIASKIFGPTADAIGSWLLDILSLPLKRKTLALTAYQKLEELIRLNHREVGHKRFTERKTYLHDRVISAAFAEYGSFLRRAIKKEWIERAVIDNYDQSDVFFAGMDLLFEKISRRDIQKIYEKEKENDQAALVWWLGQVEQRKPRLLSYEVKEWLRTEQEKWSKQ